MSHSVRSALTFLGVYCAAVFIAFLILISTYSESDPRFLSRALGLMFFSSLFSGAAIAWWIGRRFDVNHRTLGSRLQAIGNDEAISPDLKLGTVVDSLEERFSLLADEQRRLVALLNGMGEAVLLVDSEERIALMNSLGEELTGLVAQDRVADAAIPPEFANAVRDVLWSGEERVIDLEMTEDLFLSITISPIVSDDVVLGAVVLFYDVTELRKLERIRRDFVANLSHEIRTPIAVITSSAETLTLQSMNLSDVAHDFVETILRHSDRMSKMVDDLLTLSRLEARGVGIEKQAVSMELIINEVVENETPVAAQRDIQIEADAGSEQAAGDHNAISRVLQNLIENAVKYSDEGSTIFIRSGSRPEEGVVFVSVKDTGMGIESSHIDRIFERFYRVDEGRSRDVGGTGLGLAIVKHLVRAMSGDITVQSDVGEGSVFEVTFPMAKQHL